MFTTYQMHLRIQSWRPYQKGIVTIQNIQNTNKSSTILRFRIQIYIHRHALKIEERERMRTEAMEEMEMAKIQWFSLKNSTIIWAWT